MELHELHVEEYAGVYRVRNNSSRETEVGQKARLPVHASPRILLCHRKLIVY